MKKREANRWLVAVVLMEANGSSLDEDDLTMVRWCC